jgi:hypothetical protein
MCYPLDVPSNGRTMEERAEIRAKAVPGMVDGGLMVDGEISPELADMLRVLAEPQRLVDLIGFVRGPLRAVAALGATGAVLATVDEGGLEVRPIRDTALVSSIVGLLPQVPAGTGQSMSVPLEVLKTASVAPDPEDFSADPFGNDEEMTETDLLVREGVSYSDAAALTELATTRTGGGQFGVSVASRPGARLTRAQSMVTWFDTPRGRYLMFSDGAWVSLAPGGPDRIAWRIEESFKGLD